MFHRSLIYFHLFFPSYRFLQNMEIFKKGTAFRAFFKRPQKHGGHLVLCYIGLYTILQLQLVCARHHDLGKLIGSNNNNFNDNELNNLQADQQPPQQQQHQQPLNVNAQVIHTQQDEQSPLLKQTPILGQKITQQSPSDVDGPNGAVLAKDDGKYKLSNGLQTAHMFTPHWPPLPQNSIYFSFHCQRNTKKKHSNQSHLVEN